LKNVNSALWNETYPKGQVLRLGEFDIYSVGPTNSDQGMIVIYDIYGFNTSQTRVFCDRLASSYSIHVVMPDVYRGTSRPTTGDMNPWLTTVNNWTRMSDDLTDVANWLRTSYGKKQIGLVGFCWGGLQVVRACSNLSDLFTTGISIHGSRLTPDEVRLLKKPMLFIAAGNDPALEPNISSAIESADFELSKKCQYETFNNSRHGFVAAGANYSDPDNVQAINDVHKIVYNYLDRTLRNNAEIYSTNKLYFLVLFMNFAFFYF